jgi:tRNA (cmo5U34)-methyltransferase
MSKQDNLFSQPIAKPTNWVFDDKVANVFTDMVQRSIPGYSSIITMIGLLTARFVQPNTQLYDLGCSLGAVTLTMQQNVSVSGCKIIAVDNSAAMLDGCREHLKPHIDPQIPVEILQADIRNIEIHSSSVVVLNFTLQFLPPDDRQALIERIYHGLKPGGLLVLSEKFRFADSALDELLIEMHHAFKKQNGYSELEISQKRTMLENVMRLDTLQTHQTRLKQAGFTDNYLWFQCLNFSSLIAIKDQQQP